MSWIARPAIAAAVLVIAAPGCGPTHVSAAPDVVGERLDVAGDGLDASGLHYHVVGGGAFGVIVRSHWIVCRQRPRPGTRTRAVTLFAARACPAVPCDDDDPALEQVAR